MGLPTIAVPQYTLTVPSSEKEIKFRPFLVKEEKILLLAMEGEDQAQIIDATKEIIQNCVYGDINVDALPAFDLEYIFLHKIQEKFPLEICYFGENYLICQVIPFIIIYIKIIMQINKKLFFSKYYKKH